MALCCIPDAAFHLAVDTSVAISLNATGCAQAILAALPNRLVVTNVVMNELKDDVRNGRQDAEMFGKLVSLGLVDVTNISDLQEGYFENLVVGRGINTLDDGEASTIAWAVERSGIALIDEKKANRICAENFPQLIVGSTVDIFAHEAVQAAFERKQLAAAVFQALRDARMRVLPHHLNWIVDLIGSDQIVQCASISKNIRYAQLKLVAGR